MTRRRALINHVRRNLRRLILRALGRRIRVACGRLAGLDGGRSFRDGGLALPGSSRDLSLPGGLRGGDRLGRCQRPRRSTPAGEPQPARDAQNDRGEGRVKEPSPARLADAWACDGSRRREGRGRRREGPPRSPAEAYRRRSRNDDPVEIPSQFFL